MMPILAPAVHAPDSAGTISFIGSQKTVQQKGQTRGEYHPMLACFQSRKGLQAAPAVARLAMLISATVAMF
jgi:hypothetical protein